MYGHFLHVCAKKLHLVARQVVSEIGRFAFSRTFVKAEKNDLDNALKVLDLVAPRNHKIESHKCHHRLLRCCMQDLLEIGQQKCSEVVNEPMSSILNYPMEVTLDKDDVFQCMRSSNSIKEDLLLLFLELHKRGVKIDEATITSVISSCGYMNSRMAGVQLHAFLIKSGLDKSIATGSSLISLYSKYGQLSNAYQVFQEIPVRNTITWTAIIAGYAQDGQFEICLYLFSLMRKSMLKPNDFTFASLLGACTSSASLGLGRSVHCMEMRMGFDYYLHVSNALISMYAKCGSIEDAWYVFENMSSKDLISWNSMIFGYAHNGLAEQALDLLKDMKKLNIVPDAISFLGVLSSCRHAGLVDEGLWCFDLLLRDGIKPELGHYSCIVDLLGRAGFVKEAFGFIRKMPIPPNAIIWGSLLSACRVHGNVWIGIQAAENRLLLEPDCAATHVQLANLYAGVGCWNHVAKVRKLMKDRSLKTNPGYSWIEIHNTVYRFKAEDGSNSEVKEIIRILDCLADHMKSLGFVTPRNMILYDKGFLHDWY